MNALQTTTTLELDGPATWDVIKYWADMASKFQHASVAAQVMAGFGLLELKKASGVRSGVAPNLAHDAQGWSNSLDSNGVEKATPSWEELVEQRTGVSRDTARRWMWMAQGIKAKWKKLAPEARLKELMAVPPALWSEEDTKLVTDSLHKATDGMTQIEFMRELGVAKLPPGNHNAHGKGRRKLSFGEQVELLKLQAMEDGKSLERDLQAYATKFCLLTDMDVAVQIGVLDTALKARRAWLKQPKNARDIKAIEAVL